MCDFVARVEIDVSGYVVISFIYYVYAGFPEGLVNEEIGWLVRQRQLRGTPELQLLGGGGAVETNKLDRCERHGALQWKAGIGWRHKR